VQTRGRVRRNRRFNGRKKMRRERESERERE
jgi:hypothetical protein